MFREFEGKRVQEAFSGSATLTNQACIAANSLVVFNDGAANLTVTIGGVSIVVTPTDKKLDEYFAPFTKFTITATTAFRVYTRG